MLSQYILQDRFFVNKLLLFLKKIWLSEQNIFAGIYISNIKFNYPKSQNINIYYLFNNRLDYVLAYYFAKSETIKCNMNRFLSNSLIALFIKKLFYYNTDK